MADIDLYDEDLIAADENDLFRDEFRNNSQNEDNEGDEGTDAPTEHQNTTSNATKVPSKKRVVKNPQPKLNAEKLKGPRGLIILSEWFKDVHFKGKGHEHDDLNAVMSRLEQWTHRLFPKFTFDDSLARIEKLGHKKEVINYVKRIRLDMEEHPDSRNEIDAIDDEPVVDQFDSLMDNPSQTQDTVIEIINNNNISTLTNEQRARMLRNRLLAEERRQAAMRARGEAFALQQSQTLNTADSTTFQE